MARVSGVKKKSHSCRYSPPCTCGQTEGKAAQYWFELFAGCVACDGCVHVLKTSCASETTCLCGVLWEGCVFKRLIRGI